MRRAALALVAASLAFAAPASAGRNDPEGGPEKVPNRPGQSTTVLPPTSSDDPSSPPADSGEVPPPFTAHTFLGGGATTSAGTQLVTVSTSRDGRRLRLRGELLVRCDGPRAYAFPEAPDVAVGSDGKFSGEVPHADEGPAGRQQGTWKFSGRVRDGDVASGTARLVFDLTLASGETLRCDSGKLRWTARDPASRPGLGDARARATYYGLTRQLRPVMFRLDRAGKSIDFAAAGYEFGSGCKASGGGAAIPAELAALDVTRRRFKATQKQSLSVGNRRIDLTVTIAARFGRARVTGSLSVVQDVIEDGARVERCRTGTLKWQAER